MMLVKHGEYDMPSAPEPKRVTTAFLIAIEHDGTAWAHGDIEQPLVCDRRASLADMYRACAEVMKDIQSIETTQRVVQAMVQATAKIAEAEQTAKIAQKLSNSGLHIPGR